MKKRILRFLLVFVLLSTVIPVSASACGGFVAIKGEKVFHSVYCEKMTFENLDNMRWFDTAQKAKNSGLKMCESCSDYSDWDFDSEYCDSYWITDDHLLLTAMELSMEYGVSSSEEYWYERFYDEYGYLEDSDGYSSNNSYTPDELDEAYDDGYNHGYGVGYNEGVEVGLNQKENGETSWIIYAFCAAVLYGVFKYGVFFGEERNNKMIGRLHTENMELHRTLNRQEDAVYMLELIAQRGNLTMEDIADSLFVNFHKSMGYSDSDARALLNTKKLERKQNNP